MNQMARCKQDQAKKAKRRANVRAGTRLTCQPKHSPIRQKEAIPRPLMLSKLVKEVKQDKNYMQAIEGLPRRERRQRIFDLARRTMRMIREKAQHRA